MEILIILLLIILNGLFSMSEIAVVSARKSRLEQAAQTGNKGAVAALQLAKEPNTFLSTVQIGITLIGVLTGVFGGASIAELLAPLLASVPWLAPYSNALSLLLVVIIITYLSLVVGELVPKRIGLHNPERIAALVARPMNVLSKITAPLVWLLSQSTELLLRIFQLKPSEEPAVTEAEVRSMIGHGTRSGVFEEIEQDIVERVFKLSDRRAASVMTNRLDLQWLDVEEDVAANLRDVLAVEADIYLVCRRTLDEVIGVLLARKLLTALVRQTPLQLTELVEKPVFIPEAMDAFQALELLKQTTARAAVVVDEFGSVQGLLTLDDLFAALVGEIDTGPEADRQIVRREDGSYLVDAQIPIDEFIHYFEITRVDEAETAGFHSLGGLLLALAKALPQTGETFRWHGFSLEVMDMDGNRIDKVLVRRVK